MLKAIAYYRVSTDEETQALGLAAQRAGVAAFAAREGYELVAHYDDALTGATPLDQRPALLAALARVHAEHAAALIVQRRDRIGRDIVVNAVIDRAAAPASVLCADGVGNGSTPEDAMMRGILDTFAAYERTVIRGRIKAALGVKLARGEAVGIAPYGYRREGKRNVPDETEQAVVSLAKAYRTEGRSFAWIASRLTAIGYCNRSNRTFSAVTVRRMLLS